MKIATGIVRRIDHLGRIVIPKELRKTLLIDYGDALEITASESGDVILRRYSPVADSLGKEAAFIAKILSKLTDVSVVITDTNKIVASYGSIGRSLVKGKAKVGEPIIKCIQNNEIISVDNINYINTATALIDVSKGTKSYPGIKSHCIVPIIDIQDIGNVLGTVVLCSDNQRLLSEQIAQAELAAAILANKVLS